MKKEIIEFFDNIDYEGKTFTRLVKRIKTKRGWFDETEEYPVKDWYLKQVAEADRMKILNERTVVFYKQNEWQICISHENNKITNYCF